MDARHLRRPAGRRAEDQGVDHLPVIQFDYAYVSSGDARGQQVKMRTILDTSTGYGTSCVIDVKGAGEKYAISSAVSFLKELVYTRFRCRTDPEPAIKTHVDIVIQCLADDRVVEQFLPEETIPESHASLGALEGWHSLLQGQIRALRLDVEERLGSVVGVTSQCLPWLVRHASWLLNRFQRRQNGATAFENLKRVSYNKPLLQIGERCHWLEAERITHKYDPRWGIGVWLGRHTASDAHLIGTPGGVIQVRTVRRLTREQRGDELSKRAFDNFVGSPRNILGSKPSVKEQTVHGEKWTWTPGCNGRMWSRRGYHHTKACDARKRAFLVDKARAEEWRVAEAESWKRPSSAMPSSSTTSGPARNEGVQPESADQRAAPNAEPTIDSEMPDSDATRRMRIPTKRPDPGELKEEMPKRLRIVTKHSRPLWMATDTVSEQPEKRARLPEAHAEVDPETFALTRGTMETYTELNVEALDLHESDPEDMWSNDLGWVPKSDLQAAREKEVTNLQEFDTFEEVLQDEAEGDIISSRFVDKWDTSGELRSRLVSWGYEASQIDPASLFAATPSVTATRIAFVLGLAHDVDMAVADISGAFLPAVLNSRSTSNRQSSTEHLALCGE